MKSWNVSVNEPINIEGKVVQIVFFENEHGHKFAAVSIEREKGKIDDVEMPVTPLHHENDINFEDMNPKNLMHKRVSYTREVIVDEADKIKVYYRLGVLEDGGSLYAQVVKFIKQGKG
ncbi:hypothetical protein HYT23_04395 [Candidatus Pacearchaeota archaeon]|nr:hypothetical protein [Candidatus Pacearchaeota archaeon]